MADKKISQLTTLAQADVAVTADFLPIVDTSATETKKATPQSVVLGALGATSANVGIGTASPAYRLDVSGTGRVTTEIRVKNAAGNVSYLTFEENGNGNSATFISGDARTTGNIGFWTNSTERMRLDSSGNLGIGTASPLTLLDVNKITSQAPGGTTPNGAVVIRNTGVGAGCVEIGSDSPVLGYLQVRNTANQTYYDFALQPNGGNVGIGTASPGQRLHVVGGNYRQNDATNSYGFELQNGTGTSRLVTISGGSAFAIQTGGNAVDYLNLDGNGSVTIGSNNVATNATNGFLYVPTCAGTPTGTPTAKTGYAPIVVNTTNNKLYFYSGGAWRDAGP